MQRISCKCGKVTHEFPDGPFPKHADEKAAIDKVINMCDNCKPTRKGEDIE